MNKWDIYFSTEEENKKYMGVELLPVGVHFFVDKDPEVGSTNPYAYKYEYEVYKHELACQEYDRSHVLPPHTVALVRIVRTWRRRPYGWNTKLQPIYKSDWEEC